MRQHIGEAELIPDEECIGFTDAAICAPVRDKRKGVALQRHVHDLLIEGDTIDKVHGGTNDTLDGIWWKEVVHLAEELNQTIQHGMELLPAAVEPRHELFEGGDGHGEVVGADVEESVQGDEDLD